MPTSPTMVEPVYHTPTWSPGKKASEKYTDQELVRVYFEGRKDGLELHEKALYETLERNIAKSATDTSILLDELKSKGFNPKHAYLRVNTLGDLDVIITLPEKELLDEKFMNIYDFVSELENKKKADTYSIYFSFVDQNGSKDLEKNLNCDGYLFKYNG